MCMDNIVERLKERAINTKDVGFRDALELYELGKENPFLLMAHAVEIREYFKGKNVNLCGIVNAKSGICPENCKFCAQSAHYCTDCVPVNILNPGPGTPLENIPQLSPIEILVTIALYRFILSDKDIKLCGGKERNLRQLLPLGIVAGCNSLMTGDYLTTPGRDPELDKEMIRDLGLNAVLE